MAMPAGLWAVLLLAPAASQPRRTTVDSRSPLHQASYVADVAGVEHWLELAKMHAPSRQHFEDETGHRDDDGRHALFVCGFDPQVTDAERIDENCAEIAAKLLDAGLQANARDRHGWLPLHHAVHHAHVSRAAQHEAARTTASRAAGVTVAEATRGALVPLLCVCSRGGSSCDCALALAATIAALMFNLCVECWTD